MPLERRQHAAVHAALRALDAHTELVCGHLAVLVPSRKETPAPEVALPTAPNAARANAAERHAGVRSRVGRVEVDATQVEYRLAVGPALGGDVRADVACRHASS